jgi:asparagine synthase (glutamine-hydrolysing)
MCGIVGIASFNSESLPTEARLRAMCETLVHRGPDDEGYHISQGVGLGMRRLSIIDLVGGGQPISNEDGTVVRFIIFESYGKSSRRAGTGSPQIAIPRLSFTPTRNTEVAALSS